MEWFWMLLASIGAGVGTGLAGLSAATVMVPVLIAACPSFSGETGAYQATAIALASDILGSALTAATYASHKRIDLKRGWVMMVCILSMCTLGSYAAFRAGNVVLGSFSLFLTFGIGIRFLIRPESGRKRGAGGRLDLKGIAVSVFFGLTIGFGTGFVGTGGGMMMLIVFTAFLGMDTKTAVGTSTFIMAFTSLIAFTSHVLIHPAIVLEKGGALILCTGAATAASLLSARFANRVKERTVGLVTGAFLTLLGLSMLLIYFRREILQNALMAGVLHCLCMLTALILPCLLLLLIIRFALKPPAFVFRKLLHAVSFLCFSVMLLQADSWQAGALTSLLIAAVLYPVFALLEGQGWYRGFFVEKSPGEIRRSLLMLFCMFAGVIFIAWGLFDSPLIAAAAILMWGPGDAMAALIGIPFGKHPIQIPPVRGKKSLEGSAAMLLTSFVTGLVLFSFSGKLSLWQSFFAAFSASVVGTLAELFSDSEWDTVTVPLSILAVLLILMQLFC